MSLLEFAIEESQLPTLNPAPAFPGAPALDLAVVLPTFNERENIALVIEQLAQALRGMSWEAIFVDDDSPDQTAEVIAAHARRDPRIRLIHRVGRRGLSSACIEGMMASTAPLVAVMDADLQHDATVLPRMVEKLREESLEIVIGTRNSCGGSMGEFGPARVLLSRVGEKVSQSVCRTKLTDPMSGFFLVRRAFLLDVVHDLQGGGFKILVDLLAASRAPVRVGEVGYRFGLRRHGESKLDVVVGLEYLLLILNRHMGSIVPLRIALYCLVGGIGVVTHLVVFLLVSRFFPGSFVGAQVTATFVAMIENFILNNLITFRGKRLRGRQILAGAARFVTACSFGAVANVVFARALLQNGVEWYLAGLAGIILGSVWNLSVSTVITWGMHWRGGKEREPREIIAGEIEVSH